jgi:hypothetical protein
MTKTEYNTLLDTLDIVSGDIKANDLLGVSWRSSYRYAHGGIPEPIARLLRAAVALHNLDYELDEIIDIVSGRVFLA